MGVTIGVDYELISKDTNLLVIMGMILSKKIGSLILANRTQYKEENGDNICTKVCAITGECV